MQPTAYLSLGVLGLALALGTTGAAVTGPTLPTLPGSKFPGGKPGGPKLPPGTTINPPGLAGVKTVVTVTPRSLFASGVTMNVSRPLRIEGSSNRALLTKQSQLTLQFRGAASTGYRVDCSFTNNPSVLVMEYANGTLLRQASSNPANGVLNHTIAATGSNRNLKVWMQANKDTDWSQCKISPL